MVGGILKVFAHFVIFVVSSRIGCSWFAVSLFVYLYPSLKPVVQCWSALCAGVHFFVVCGVVLECSAVLGNALCCVLLYRIVHVSRLVHLASI